MAEAGILVRIFPLMLEVQSDLILRPSEFVKKPTYLDDSEDDESTVGKMPPTEDSEADE